MREIVDEDIGSGVRLITRYCLNTTGVTRTTKTEKFDPNLTDSITGEDDDIKNVSYDNFQEVSGIENLGNIVYDKVTTTLADGTKLFTFNDRLALTFKETFDCDFNSYVDNIFYIDHNVYNCRLTRFLFKEINPYDENSHILIFINDELVFDHLISDISVNLNKDISSPVFEFPIELSKYYQSRTKWQIFITGNDSPNSYGKLYVEFESIPANAPSKDDIVKNAWEQNT